MIESNIRDRSPPGSATPASPMTRPRLNILNLIVLPVGHALGVLAIVYLAAFQFSWWTIGLAVVWMLACSISVTGGYHRLFAHPTHKARWPLRLFYLLFGAGAVMNSALQWSSDHRLHHAHTDKDEDPYNARRGFLWSHIGWIFFERQKGADLSNVPDLARDPLVVFQHRAYIPLVAMFCIFLPAALGLLWGDPIGALLCAGFLRLVIQWHFTFSINSFAHIIGTQPYSTRTTARDSWITALVSLGEGYHNYHHRFQGDYRNGVRWWQFDPTKWFLWTMSKVGLARDLRRMSPEAIERARLRTGRATAADR